MALAAALLLAGAFLAGRVTAPEASRPRVPLTVAISGDPDAPAVRATLGPPRDDVVHYTGVLLLSDGARQERRVRVDVALTPGGVVEVFSGRLDFPLRAAWLESE